MDNPLQRLGMVSKSHQGEEVHMENIGVLVLPGILLFLILLGYMWWRITKDD
jgi:hypothetical protein